MQKEAQGISLIGRSIPGVSVALGLFPVAPGMMVSEKAQGMQRREPDAGPSLEWYFVTQ